jgi:hypothetical protein
MSLLSCVATPVPAGELGRAPIAAILADSSASPRLFRIEIDKRICAFLP